MRLRGTTTAITVVFLKFYKILRTYCNAKPTTSHLIICNRRAYWAWSMGKDSGQQAGKD
jgi:hypothetical protein